MIIRNTDILHYSIILSITPDLDILLNTSGHSTYSGPWEI